ncbi:hypothetical protein L1887_40551 [Cichorium endivia]|nr:hypothetical protein L1887_40551 [Cichorium endivia]
MKQGNIGNYFNTLNCNKRPRSSSNNESGEGSSQRPNLNVKEPNQPMPPISNVIPPKPSCNETFDVKDIPRDPGDRPMITTYDSKIRDEVRKRYLIQGPCRIRVHKFPSKRIGNKDRKFVPIWYNDFDWLEYSKKKDKAYCLYCYVCGDMMGQKGGRDAFVTKGFDSWNKAKDTFRAHVGDVDSFHNKARERCELLMKPSQTITESMRRTSEREKRRYNDRLRVSVSACRYLLKNALPFRGHDESSDSLNRGLYIETIKVIGENNDEIFDNTLEKAPKNNKIICPKSQKDIVECFAQEILLSIRKEIGEDVFGLLVDESSDVSKKEQMAIVLRHVDRLGYVKERFIGVVHVKDTSAMTLKNAIDEALTSNGFSFTQVRGQGYDGASNMRGEFNGLKALILQENESAFYVHCFAHQLQLVIVAVAKKHADVRDFFEETSLVVNVVCGSCKRKYLLRELSQESRREGIANGELETGKGLNQETTLIRAGDTRWGSHFNTISSLMKLYSGVLDVLANVEKEGGTLQNRRQAGGILLNLKTYEFVFYLHLMYEVLHRTNILSKELQKQDLDILEAACMVRATMDSLQKLRDTGFDSILPKVSSFCEKHEIKIVDMADLYVGARNRKTSKTNEYHFKVEIFNTVVDMQIVEFRERFTKMYKRDFSDLDIRDLEGQLDIYYHSCIKDERFTSLKGISELSCLMVKTGRHKAYHLVYKLLKLTLILPVATATVERCFSKMKLVKTDLRNKIGDDFLNDA